MQLSQLDAGDLFSLTLWRNESGYCAGVQKRAGDLVKYETRKTASEAVEAALRLIASDSVDIEQNPSCVTVIAPPPF